MLNNHRLDLPHHASLNPIRLLSVCPINETKIFNFKEHTYLPTTYVVREKVMVHMCSSVRRGGEGVGYILFWGYSGEGEEGCGAGYILSWSCLGERRVP